MSPSGAFAPTSARAPSPTPTRPGGQALGWHLLRDRWGLHAAFGIEAPVLRAWLAFVAAAYGRGAVYHSATHAADVLQTVHFVLQARTGLSPRPPSLCPPPRRGFERNGCCSVVSASGRWMLRGRRGVGLRAGIAAHA